MFLIPLVGDHRHFLFGRRKSRTHLSRKIRQERQRYLQRALKTHEKIEFSEVDVSEYKAMPSTRHSRFD